MNSFDKLPGGSRIWIYQANRALTDTEIKEIQQKADEFVIRWAAHGKKLTAASKTFYNRFLVLTVDEKNNGASGCSIDSSVNFIKELEAQYEVTFLDRSKVAYITGKDVILIDLKRIKDHIDSRDITGDTLVFNNLVETKEAFENDWLIPAKESWMKKYFRN